MEYNQVKIEVYIPKTHLIMCRDALNDSGLLKIGNYDMCITTTDVTGYFRPLKGANPYKGIMNKITRVDEVKLEFSCFKNELEKVIEIIKQVHPYEEPVLRIIPLFAI